MAVEHSHPQLQLEAGPEPGLSGDVARWDFSCWVDRRWVVSGAISSGVHLAVLTVIALVWWSIPEPPTNGLLSALVVDTTLEQVEEQHLIETPELLSVPATEMSTLPSGGAAAALRQAALAAESLQPASQSTLLTAGASRQSWMNADVSAAVELGSPRLGAGSGTGEGVGADGGDGFFGLPPLGRRFVYVLDRSRSMNHPHNTAAKTRFKRLKLELVRSVGGLSAEMQFFMVFFNDFPIGMPSPNPVQATPRVQQHYLEWMSELKADGNTEPLSALQIALRMQPDVIYFLTDGSFTYRVEQEILGLPSGRTKIHTFAFEEPMTPEMRRAYAFLQDNKGARARQSVETKKEFDKVVAAWRAHKFLQNMAKRHHGTFKIIPDNG